MVAFFSPTIFFLHEEGHSRVLDVPHCGVDVLDEVLRSFCSFDELSIEAIILGIHIGTYLSMRLS